MLDGLLQLEQYTSMLLGRLWCSRPRAGRRDIDPMLVMGSPILRASAEHGWREARMILAGIAGIERGPLGLVAQKLEASLDDVPIPEWTAKVGTATILRALAQQSPGDGEALLLEVDDAAETPHMVAAFINDRHGGHSPHQSYTKLTIAA